MARFTLERLLISVIGIAVGIGGITFVCLSPFSEPRALSLIGIWIASGGIIGASSLYPFRMAFAGALVGVMAQFIVMLLFLR